MRLYHRQAAHIVHLPRSASTAEYCKYARIFFLLMIWVADVSLTVLALQNLNATLPKRDSEQAVELGALNSSLNMMSKDM